MLRYNLEKQGFRVEEAADGQEALTRIAETQPDLVLLDWMLPVMSGIEVCRQIRRRPATRDLPVIMVTARTEDQDAVRGLNTGRGRLHHQAVQHGVAARADARAAAALQRRAGEGPAHISTTSRWTSPRTACSATAGRSISARPSSACWSSSCSIPAACSRARSCWTRSGDADIHVEPRTVDVHIRRLRKSINATGELDWCAPCARRVTRWIPSRSDARTPAMRLAPAGFDPISPARRMPAARGGRSASA